MDFKDKKDKNKEYIDKSRDNIKLKNYSQIKN